MDGRRGSLATYFINNRAVAKATTMNQLFPHKNTNNIMMMKTIIAAAKYCVIPREWPKTGKPLSSNIIVA